MANEQSFRTILNNNYIRRWHENVNEAKHYVVYGGIRDKMLILYNLEHDIYTLFVKNKL